MPTDIFQKAVSMVQSARFMALVSNTVLDINDELKNKFFLMIEPTGKGKFNIIHQHSSSILQVENPPSMMIVGETCNYAYVEDGFKELLLKELMKVFDKRKTYHLEMLDRIEKAEQNIMKHFPDIEF